MSTTKLATIIVSSDTGDGEYDMFDVQSLDQEGAVLCGPLFLEVGELLKLRVHRMVRELILKARVLSVSQSDELMTIQFVDLDSKTKKLIAQ